MGDAIRLKPCPFCGGEANIKHSGGAYWVECGKCHVETGVYYGEADAAAAWNRRAKMNARKAVAIFKDIRNAKYTPEEKEGAIYFVCKMPTHNGITKKDMIDALRWLFMVV